MANKRRYFFSTPAVVAWLVLLIVIVAIYFVLAKQETPYTSKAIVYAHVVSLSPEVSGYVIKSDTSLTKQFVTKGKTLLTIDPNPYQLKVNIAKNQLSITKDRVKELSLQINNMEKALEAKQTALTAAKLEYQKFNKLFENKFASLAKIQQLTALVKIKQADVDQAKITLKQARQELGKTVDGVNVHIHLAENKLKLAQFYLSKTLLKAPANGFIENMYIHQGDYVVPGESKIPFIVANSWWIEGLVTENGISNLQVGQPALVVLDLYPGHIFHATVTSVGHGVQVKAIEPTGNLPEYNSASDWFQPQQVFPFGVNINPTEQKHLQLRVGATGSIVVLKPGFSLWNGLAYIVMGFKSLWAYL